MAKCEKCGKTTTTGHNVSHSIRRTKRTFKPNIRKVKVTEEGKVKRVKICAKCLRSNQMTKAL